MPYIKQLERETFKTALALIADGGIVDKGELEYLICSLMDIYMEERPWKYSYLHDCCYAAQHCADEFRRRFLDWREDQARHKNGEVFVNIQRRVD